MCSHITDYGGYDEAKVSIAVAFKPLSAAMGQRGTVRGIELH